MSISLEITEYYELVALHKALHVARFARNPLIPALPGSPYLAEIARRVVEILSEMEIERGKPERANDWRIPIDEKGEVWKIAVQNAAIHPDSWREQTQEKKIEIARIYLSPFLLTKELLENFVHQVDKAISE